MNYVISGCLYEFNAIVDVSQYGARVQELRLYAALLESGWRVKVNEQQKIALEFITEYFPIMINKFSGELVHNIEVKIDHATPKTIFGNVERRLIFPEWMFQFAASSSFDRDISCSFQGFPSTTRILLALDLLLKSGSDVNKISKYITKFLAKNRKVPFRNYLLNKVFNSFFNKYKYKFEWSTRGRKVKNKMIDKEYWKVLQESRTVYCPPGDFVWTYRFYEAVMSGAIPILEHDDQDVINSGYFVLKNLFYSNDINFSNFYCEAKKNKFDIAFKELTAKSELSPKHFNLE